MVLRRRDKLDRARRIETRDHEIRRHPLRLKGGSREAVRGHAALDKLELCHTHSQVWKGVLEVDTVSTKGAALYEAQIAPMVGS